MRGGRGMIRLSVFCPGCGKWLKRLVDEDCPPLSLRCTCGIRFSFGIKEEPPLLMSGGTWEMLESEQEEVPPEFHRTIEAEHD
jgi:hypothetical protein